MSILLFLHIHICKSSVKFAIKPVPEYCYLWSTIQSSLYLEEKLPVTSVEFFKCLTEATDNNHVLDLGVAVHTHTEANIECIA